MSRFLIIFFALAGILSVTSRAATEPPGVITVSNRAELDTAITALSNTATDAKIVMRPGHYGHVTVAPSVFVGNKGTVTFTSEDPAKMAQMTLTLGGLDGGKQGRLVFDQIDFFESYDTFMKAYPDVKGATVTSTNFAIIRLVSPVDVTIRRSRIRSDMLPSYDTSLGAKYREAKQAKHPNGSFLFIKATEALGNVDGLVIEDCEISDIFYGLLLRGNNIICRRNTFHDIWCDMHDLFAPSTNVLIEDTYAYNIVGDTIHPDFIQIYTRGKPYKGIKNLTFRRNVVNAGPKSAFVEHTETKPQFGVDASRLTLQGFRVEGSLEGCENWTVQDNVFGGVTSSAIFLPIVVPNSTILRNTIAPMFRNGSNNRVATTIRVTFQGGSGSVIAENVGAGLGVLVKEPAGVEVRGNVGGFNASSVESVGEYFVGPSFELSAMTSKEVMLSAYRPKPGGPLDSAGDAAPKAGAIGKTLQGPPVDWSQNPPISAPLSANSGN